jgi:H+/Cl- antiporter ClcA
MKNNHNVDPAEEVGSTINDKHAIERYFSRRLQVAMVGEGVLVGLAGGIVITLYRLALSRSESLLRGFLSSAGPTPARLGLLFAGLLCAAVIVARLMQFEPDTRGSGIPQVDAEVMGRLDMRWPRVLVIKFVEGVLCTLSGLSLGREGPSVLLGAMAGKGVSRTLNKEQGEEHVLVTCGAAAGMSAAFHAPLTGVLFALEEIHREFNAPLVISVMASAAMADFVTSHVLGVSPVLHFAVVGDLPHADYAFVLLMGVICGVLGALHNVGMHSLQSGPFAWIRQRWGDAVLLVAFLGSGIVALVAPELLCGGDAILQHLEQGTGLSFALVLSLLVGKYLFTSICFGTGAPGGTLLPLVIMGALIGTLCGFVAVGVTDVPLTYFNNFIVLGVAGMFAGSVRAPVTAVVLCFELTGTMDTLLAATAVSLIAYVTANMLKVEPFYETLLSSLLAKLPEPEGYQSTEVVGSKVLHTHVVGVGSLVEGKAVSEVPWPHNTLLVTIDRAGQRIVPSGPTQLQALDHVLFIMDADLESDTELLLQGLFGGLSDESSMGTRQGTEQV